MRVCGGYDETGFKASYSDVGYLRSKRSPCHCEGRSNLCVWCETATDRHAAARDDASLLY